MVGSKKRKDDDPGRNQHSNCQLESRFHSYTPMNTTPKQVLMEVRDKRILKWPSKMKANADKWDKRKYYHYYRDHDYTIADCFDLKEEIKSLIRDGHLREYVYRKRDERPDQRDEQQGNKDDVDGGSSTEHHVNFAYKPTKEQRLNPCGLTFTKEDARGIHHPHDDVLVVTMTMVNHMVHRILVDTDNLVAILFAVAFDKMGIEMSRLRPIGTPLLGFAGGRVTSEGSILLPVTV
ncbi:uncharacterized protein LOC131218052 [Magnolia sinica]|uniref:uncharacterized protein LOC131218052 n=1 Tax=Magnolia sinica TaxID=86752 RepID=UPI00265AC671|nr:uncharacterized protein LOC131218052 [Magnolia sinica]